MIPEKQVTLSKAGKKRGLIVIAISACEKHFCLLMWPNTIYISGII